MNLLGASFLPEPSDKRSQKLPAGVSAAASSSSLDAPASSPETTWIARSVMVTISYMIMTSIKEIFWYIISGAKSAYLSTDKATSMRTWWWASARWDGRMADTGRSSSVSFPLVLKTAHLPHGSACQREERSKTCGAYRINGTRVIHWNKKRIYRKIQKRQWSNVVHFFFSTLLCWSKQILAHKILNYNTQVKKETIKLNI